MNVNRYRGIVNLASASKHKLHTIGFLYLWMGIGGYACRQPFVVVRRLAANVTIGCTFLDDHAESLQIRRKVLILADGTVVPIPDVLRGNLPWFVHASVSRWQRFHRGPTSSMLRSALCCHRKARQSSKLFVDELAQ